MHYPLTISNGYTVIEIDGRKYMLDTGAVSMTMDLGALRTLRIGDRTIPMRACTPEDRVQLERGVRMPLAGIIGGEVVLSFGGITCDLREGTATFGTPTRRDGVAIPSRNYYVNALVNGRQVNAYMDTGAPNVIVTDHSLLDLSRPLSPTEESSFTGTRRTDRFSGELTIGEVTLTLPMLKWIDPRALPPVCFSVSAFAKEYYAIDAVARVIRFL